MTRTGDREIRSVSGTLPDNPGELACMPLIFFHQGNVANTVECFLWVRNLSCVSFVAIFVSRPYLWESDRIGCFVAYFFCLNNLGRSKSHFYPFGETKLPQRHTRNSRLAPQHEKDYGTCGNGE